ARFLQSRLQRFAPVDADGVLGIDAGVVRLDVGRVGNAGLREQRGVAGCDPLPQFDLVLEYLQLGQQDRRLQRVQPAVHADADVVVAAILAVARDLPYHHGKPVVVGEDRAAIAVAAQRLAGEETGAGDRAQAARTPPLVARAE